jgi:hypothetical protein
MGDVNAADVIYECIYWTDTFIPQLYSGESVRQFARGERRWLVIEIENVFYIWEEKVDPEYDSFEALDEKDRVYHRNI